MGAVCDVIYTRIGREEGRKQTRICINTQARVIIDIAAHMKKYPHTLTHTYGIRNVLVCS